MLQKPGLYLLFLIILFSVFSIRLAAPPRVVPETAPDSVFSAKRAFTYLLQVARAPHSTGTEENKRVRDYITRACESLGLATQVQNTTAARERGSIIQAANVYNVLARLKGQTSGKCVLVMAHYDSTPNTPGAGDDGAAVAAMLETARILTSTKVILQNDVVFLFTDAEEPGLLGAQGFLQDTVLAKEVGVVLNFEARGNAGISIMFETNPQNGWIVKEFMKAAAYPFANSLSFEIYRLLPNDTDYSLFKGSGITGLNHAFIDGFVNYHSPTDRPERLDLRSLQHHGSNMLSLIKHFGNIPLIKTKAPDISYFNVLGSWMVYYPATWNIYFVILCSALFIIFLIIGIRENKISTKGLLIGLLAFIGALLILFFANFLLIKAIQAAYPYYNRFYASNSYNNQYYYFAITALAVAIFCFLYQWLLRRFNASSLLAGILLVQIIMLLMMYMAIPTAIFILFFPLFFFILGQIILFHWKVDGEKRPWLWSVMTLVFLLPAIVLLSPVIRLMFVTFGLGSVTAAVAIVLSLLLGFLLPVFSPIFKDNSHIVSLGAAVCFITALLVAHFHSRFTKEHPLQTSVHYELNADEEKAYWVSDFIEKDEWNQQFFTNATVEKEPALKHAGMPASQRLKNEAPVLSFSAPVATLIKDTVANNRRKLLVHFQSNRDAVWMRVAMGENNPATNIEVNGKKTGTIKHKSLPDADEYTLLVYFGLSKGGFDVLFEVAPSLPFEITLIDGSLGLPHINGYKDYTANVIPGVGWNSNTTQVSKRFVF